MYAGLFNSSYHPSPVELFFIKTPQDQLGPLYIGQLFVTLLQGVMLVQYYDYIFTFLHEKRWTKWLVHSTFWLCLVKFVYGSYYEWDKFVLRFGDWGYLVTFSPKLVPFGILTTIPTAVCQAYYIHRCWVLSHNRFFLITSASSLVTTVGSGIALTWGDAMAAGGDAAVTRFIKIAANVSLSSGLACDVLITTFTCYYLSQNKSEFASTNYLVTRLVKYSIESAAGPTVVALINLVLTNKTQGNQWFAVPNVMLSHVYGCSLLYTVNGRKTMNGTPLATIGKPLSNGSSGGQIHSPLGRGPMRNSGYPLQDFSPNSRPGVFVEVRTETDMIKGGSLHDDDSSMIPRIDGNNKGARFFA